MKTSSICPHYDLCEKRSLMDCARCEHRDEASGILLWRRTFSGDRAELILMITAGVSLALGWLSTWMGWATMSTLGYSMTYLAGGWFGTINAFQSLREKELDVDLLMILAALGAAIVGAPFEGGMLLFLFSISNVLQNHALSHSRSAVRSLMALRPATVLAEYNGETRLVPLENVEIGTCIRLRPGDRIALDGEVIEGDSTMDESSLTGESMPVHKTCGSLIFAGTINQNGSLLYRVTKLAGDSTLARIIGLVEQAQDEKAKTQRFLEKAERFYASAVILFTLALIVLPPLTIGAAWSESFYRAMTILVVASPCALVISTPAVFLAAIAGAAKRGVLFKGGIHLERIASVDTVAFDKTGTLTTGKPEVTDIELAVSSFGCEGDHRKTQMDLLQLAASVESQSEHPIARAIEKYCRDKRCGLLETSGFRSFPGKGAQAKVSGRDLIVGSPSLILECGSTPDDAWHSQVQNLADQGKTVVVVAESDPLGKLRKVLGWIGIADHLREDASGAVKTLKTLGIRRIVMLTGDNPKVAANVARQVGIDEWYARLLPEDKLVKVGELANEGTVAMVGDGVNDAPALAKAHVGIAMGAAGTDVAMETADVVLMSSHLKHLANAFALARKSRIVVTQNLVFALGVIVVLVIAAMVSRLPLPLGVLGHEGSTVLVCLNGLRLLRFQQDK